MAHKQYFGTVSEAFSNFIAWIKINVFKQK